MAFYGSMPVAARPPSSSGRKRLTSAIVLSVAAVALLAMAGLYSSSSVVLESMSPMDDGGLPTSVVMKDMGKIDTKTTLSSKAGHSDKPVVSDLEQLSSPKVKDTTGRISDDADGMSDGQLAVLEEAADYEPLGQQHNQRNFAERMNARVDQEFAAAKHQKSAKLRHYKKELDTLNQGFAEQMQKALTGSSNVGDVTAIIDAHDANYLRHTARYGKSLSLQTQKAILAAAENQNAKEKKGLIKAEGHGMVHTHVHHARSGVVHTQDGFVLRPEIAKAARTTSLLAQDLRTPTGKPQLHMHSVGIADTVDGAPPVEEADPRLDTPDGCACDGPANEDAGPRCNCIGDPEFVSPESVFSPEEVTTWKSAAAQILKMPVAVTKRNDQVLPTADSINTFLQDLLERVDQQATGHEPASLTEKLEKDVTKLESLAARDPLARDLMARRLTKLSRVLPSETQQLLDFDTVYVPPYVDDLDDYLQGVIDEVEKTEIPNLDEEEEKKGAPQQLKQREHASETKQSGAVLPSLFAISFEVKRLMDASLKLHPAKTEEDLDQVTHLQKTAQSLVALVSKDPAARDLVAEKLSLLKKASRVQGKVAKGQKEGEEVAQGQQLLDYDTVYIAPYVDDLDDYLAAVIAEVESTEIPSLDEEEEKKGAPQQLRQPTQSLAPLPYITQNIRALNRAHYHGEYEDKMEWQRHPFDTPPEERPNAAKRFGDHWGDTMHTMVHGAHNLRDDTEAPNPVHNAWGYEGSLKGAEAPVQSADGPDTATAAGVQTQKSLQYGTKLCKLVNCYNEDANPFPRAARWARYQGLKEAAEKVALGDEIMDLGISSGINDGDVIVPVDSDSVSSAIYTARKPHLPSVRGSKARKESDSGNPFPL